MSSPAPDPNAGDQGGGAPPPGAGAPPAPAPGGPPPGAAPPDQGAGGGGQSQIEGLLTRMLEICTNLRNASPLLASGLQKACNGLQEAHTSLKMGRPVTPAAPEQNPPY